MLSAKNKKIIIVISEFNIEIIDRLLKGAIKAYSHHGGMDKHLQIFRVPGAFEIPGTIQLILKNEKPDAVVAIGSVIKGETPHFNFVAGESSRGISEISRQADIPIINGILTTDNLKQAMKRSNPSDQNKGWDAMEAAIQTISVYKDIQAIS